MTFKSTFWSVALLIVLPATSEGLSYLGSFAVPDPDTLFFEPSQSTDKVALFITSPLNNDLYEVADIEGQMKKLGTGNLSYISLKHNNLSWVNSGVRVPLGIFSGTFDFSLLLADGMMLPGMNTGGLYVQHFSAEGLPTGEPFAITATLDYWWYSMAKFVDMNGDGRLDVLTARAMYDFDHGKGELVWLEQPGKPVPGIAWLEHQLTPGPDTFFDVADLDGNNQTLEVVAAQIFTGRLTINRIDVTSGKFLASHVIADNIGAVDSVRIVDLNADGELDLLVSERTSDGNTTAVLAFEIPKAPMTDAYTLHVLATGFPVISIGESAPGFSYAVQGHVSGAKRPPSVLVAGDGSQSAYLLTPQNDHWQYSKETIYAGKGAVISLGTYDVDGDGYLEVFVPDIGTSMVNVYTFKPNSTHDSIIV